MKSEYAQIEQVLDPPDRDNLAQAQQAWLRYRDLTCAAESSAYFDHGTGASPARAACLEAETRLRLNDLHAIYGMKLQQAGR